MKFEKIDGNKKHRKRPYAVTLETYEEVEVVVAAFRESIYRKVESGDLDSISDFEKLIARIEDLEEIALRLPTIETITKVLDKFQEGTNDAVEEISNFYNAPPYADRSIVERLDLGQSALALSTQIKKAAATPLEDQEKMLEEDKMVDELMADLDSMVDPPPDNP